MDPADDLPRAHIKRIVKGKLTELMASATDAKGKTVDGHVQKEALLAFSECAKIFIHYLTATANEMCRDGKRQTISVDDVLKAIDEIEFSEEMLEPLTAALAGFKTEAAKKTRKKTDAANKKRKSLEPAEGEGGDEEDGGADGEGEGEGGEEEDADEAEAAGEDGDDNEDDDDAGEEEEEEEEEDGAGEEEDGAGEEEVQPPVREEEDALGEEAAE